MLYLYSPLFCRHAGEAIVEGCLTGSSIILLDIFRGLFRWASTLVHSNSSRHDALISSVLVYGRS